MNLTLSQKPQIGPEAATLASIYPQGFIEEMDKIKNEFIQDEMLPFLNNSFPTLMELPEKFFGAVGNPWDFISGPFEEVFTFLGNESSLGALMDVFDMVANSTEG